MELARLKKNEPIGSNSTKCFGNAIPEVKDAKGIEKTQDGSDCISDVSKLPDSGDKWKFATK